MTTLNKKVDFSKQEIQQFLTTLNHFKHLEDYQQLGYTLHSLGNIMQTALLAEMEHPKYSNHNKWDMYNHLSLIKSLVPNNELELLDKLND